MRFASRVAGVAVHLLLVAAAVVAVLMATSRLADPSIRVALVSMAGFLSAVTVLGRFPLGLGPVAASGAARIVRLVGVVLAGGCAAIAGVGLVRPGASSFVRSATGIPLYALVLAVCLAAFLAATRRDSGLRPRMTLMSVCLGLLAAALFAAAVPILPPVAIVVAYLLIAGAAVGASWLRQPAESRASAALLAIVTACQGVFLAAAVLYRYGPDAWMPYAGPGPLTPQGQLEQNRAEAIDPYVGVLFLGLIAAIVVVGMALSAWRRARAVAGSAAVPAA